MPRLAAVFRAAIVAAALLALPGCSLFQSRRPTGDPTVIAPARLRTMAVGDRARLAGEDRRGSGSHVVYGVDVSDDSWYWAPFHVVGGATLRLVDFINGERPINEAVAMEDTKSPDHRREGILKIVGRPFARRNPYTKRYAQISQEAGTDPSVRAAALRALNRSRDKSAVDLYAKSLESPEVGVRLEAAKALANIPSDTAAPALIQHLAKDDNKDVRIACADALRVYKTLDASRALINVLGDRDFAVSWQARQSLRLMTGRDFRYDDVAWLNYFSKAGKPFL